MLVSFHSTTSPSLAERNWAALAHLSALLTVLAGAYTGGVGAVLALFVPLGMYLYFGTRSRYVAYHALQATAFQALGGAALVLLALATFVVLAGAWLLTGLLTLALIGLALWPVVLIVTLLAVACGLGLGAAWLAYPVWGAYRAQTGAVFEYPMVGRWAQRLLRA